MTIVYTCRHCEQVIGQIKKDSINLQSLGLDQLSQAEKERIIDHDVNGTLHLNVICESCEQSLIDHPKYHELDFFIH